MSEDETVTLSGRDPDAIRAPFVDRITELEEEAEQLREIRDGLLERIRELEVAYDHRDDDAWRDAELAMACRDYQQACGRLRAALELAACPECHLAEPDLVYGPGLQPHPCTHPFHAQRDFWREPPPLHDAENILRGRR